METCNYMHTFFLNSEVKENQQGQVCDPIIASGVMRHLLELALCIYAKYDIKWMLKNSFMTNLMREDVSSFLCS